MVYTKKKIIKYNPDLQKISEIFLFIFLSILGLFSIILIFILIELMFINLIIYIKGISSPSLREKNPPRKILLRVL